MAGTTTKTVMSLVATSSSHVRNLVIKDGQLIFIKDRQRIAFDHKGERVFYNQISELETEAERLTMEAPLEGYYFVIGTGILWFYKEQWIQITEKPSEIIHIGVELPELGQAKENTLYVNKAGKEIAVYDRELNNYIVVSDYTNEATEADIENLFK